MKKTELILVIIAMAGVTLRILELPGGGVLTVLPLTILSIIYMLLGFVVLNGLQIRKVFKRETYKDVSQGNLKFSMIAGWTFSIVLIAIFSKIQSYPGLENLIGFWLIILSVLIVVAIFLQSRNKSDLNVRILKRGIPILLAGIFAMLFF